MLAQTVLAVLGFAATLASATPTVSEKHTAVASAPKEKRTTHYGNGTPYYQYGVAGSCGNYNSDSSVIVALSNSWMDNEYQSPYCGRLIQATNTGSGDGVPGAGNTVVVTVQDTCPGCSADSLDFSIGAWNQLTNGYPPDGNFNVEWHFCNEDGQC